MAAFFFGSCLEIHILWWKKKGQPQRIAARTRQARRTRSRRSWAAALPRQAQQNAHCASTLGFWSHLPATPKLL
jgi:hypothetical protein